jgi:hypothetical protein
MGFNSAFKGLMVLFFLYTTIHREMFFAHIKKKVKQSRYRPGVAQRIPGI